MGIAAELHLDHDAALAALAWQVDLGVSEVVQETPQDSFDLPEAAPWARRAVEAAPPPLPAAPPPPVPSGPGDIQRARDLAAACATLEELHAALRAFDLCDLKRGARSTVFAAGNPAARVLLLTEAPGREEDLEGRPIAGLALQLLNAMFAAIGLSLDTPGPEAGLYITPVIPWRPPGNREPDPAEIALLRPFVERHITLADPDLIVTLGPSPISALLRGPATRGIWTEALGRPLLPMTHPAQLLRNPAAKRESWADLLQIKARLT